MVAATIVYEGDREEVGMQERAVRRLSRRYGGMRAGAANGQRGYALTFGIAYLRDFVMRHWVVAESFETSMPWSAVIPTCEAVKQRIEAEYRERGLPGQPFISCRVTQVYETGVCVYFYLAFWHKGVDQPVEIFEDLERCARDEILRHGGSISRSSPLSSPRDGSARVKGPWGSCPWGSSWGHPRLGDGPRRRSWSRSGPTRRRRDGVATDGSCGPVDATPWSSSRPFGTALPTPASSPVPCSGGTTFTGSVPGAVWRSSRVRRIPA